MRQYSYFDIYCDSDFYSDSDSDNPYPSDTQEYIIHQRGKKFEFSNPIQGNEKFDKRVYLQGLDCIDQKWPNQQETKDEIEKRGLNPDNRKFKIPYEASISFPEAKSGISVIKMNLYHFQNPFFQTTDAGLSKEFMKWGQNYEYYTVKKNSLKIEEISFTLDPANQFPLWIYITNQEIDLENITRAQLDGLEKEINVVVHHLKMGYKSEYLGYICNTMKIEKYQDKIHILEQEKEKISISNRSHWERNIRKVNQDDTSYDKIFYVILASENDQLPIFGNNKLYLNYQQEGIFHKNQPKGKKNKQFTVEYNSNTISFPEAESGISVIPVNLYFFTNPLLEKNLTKSNENLLKKGKNYKIYIPESVHDIDITILPDPDDLVPLVLCITSKPIMQDQLSPDQLQEMRSDPRSSVWKIPNDERDAQYCIDNFQPLSKGYQLLDSNLTNIHPLYTYTDFSIKRTNIYEDVSFDTFNFVDGIQLSLSENQKMPKNLNYLTHYVILITQNGQKISGNHKLQIKYKQNGIFYDYHQVKQYSQMNLNVIQQKQEQRYMMIDVDKIINYNKFAEIQRFTTEYSSTASFKKLRNGIYAVQIFLYNFTNPVPQANKKPTDIFKLGKKFKFYYPVSASFKIEKINLNSPKNFEIPNIYEKLSERWIEIENRWDIEGNNSGILDYLEAILKTRTKNPNDVYHTRFVLSEDSTPTIIQNKMYFYYIPESELNGMGEISEQDSITFKIKQTGVFSGRYFGQEKDKQQYMKQLNQDIQNGQEKLGNRGIYNMKS